MTRPLSSAYSQPPSDCVEREERKLADTIRRVLRCLDREGLAYAVQVWTWATVRDSVLLSQDRYKRILDSLESHSY